MVAFPGIALEEPCLLFLMEANLMHTQKNMVTPERRVAFYSKEVEPNHKRAPTSMVEIHLRKMVH
jgi:hypothetical protein